EPSSENKLSKLFLEITKVYKKYNLYKKLKSSPSSFPIDHKIQKLIKTKNKVLKIKSTLLTFYNRIYKQCNRLSSKSPRLHQHSEIFQILDNQSNTRQLRNWIRKRPHLTNLMLQVKIMRVDPNHYDFDVTFLI